MRIKYMQNNKYNNKYNNNIWSIQRYYIVHEGESDVTKN